MSERNLIIMTKIIMFYSIFVVVMKIIFVFQQYSSEVAPEILEALVIAIAIIAVPFILLATIGFLLNRNRNYSWIFVIVGAVVIIAVRAYEIQLMQYLRDLFLH